MNEIKFTIEKIGDVYKLCGEDQSGNKKYAALKTNEPYIVDIAKNSIAQAFQKEKV